MSTVVTEHTGKRLKLHTLIATFVCLIGIVVAVAYEQGTTGFLTGCVTVGIGSAWFAITRFRIWWKHG